MQRIRVRRGQRQTQAIGNPACWPAALHRPSRVTAKATNQVLKRRLTLGSLVVCYPQTKMKRVLLEGTCIGPQAMAGG
jgi:hypothetical protein